MHDETVPISAPRLRHPPRHPSGIWTACPSCGLDQPVALDCAVCGAEMASPKFTPTMQAAPVQSLVARPVPTAPAATYAARRVSPTRIPLEIAPDLRDGALRSRYVPPVVVWGGFVLGSVLLFLGISWFFEFTRGEMRAMAEVVDRLALPANSCPDCEKQYRIIGLRAQPYYDPPTDRMDLLDPEQAGDSTRWVEELRQEVLDFKAWSAQQRALQSEAERELRESGY